jgi:hypothetical protein
MHHPCCRVLHVAVLSLVVAAPPPCLAAEEWLVELRPAPLSVEGETAPDPGGELPRRSYPVERVEQLPFHGAWHEFVNVTTGGLVFRMADLKLPGRMPLDFGRIQFFPRSSSQRASAGPPGGGGGSESEIFES